MELDDIKKKVRIIIQEIISNNGLDFVPPDEESLINGGVLDSMSIMGLISTLEQEFSINFNPFEFTIDNLDDINKISDFLLDKKLNDVN